LSRHRPTRCGPKPPKYQMARVKTLAKHPRLSWG
jgi:hypothetical protein